MARSLLSRITMRALRVVFLLGLGHGALPGCQADDAGALDASVRSSPEADANCHVDCFGFHECHDGVVTSWLHAPVPCQYFTGTCPSSVTYHCAQGCRVDTDRLFEPFASPSVMCEENRPKQVGDPCVDESGCRPEVATWDAAGHVEGVYLRCDTDAGRCAARDAPVVDDWLAQCGLVIDDQPGFAYGVAEADACAGGLCLYLETDTCMLQGCTIPCGSDGECPAGSVCEPDWKVCKPGPPRLLGVDLSCP